MVLFLQRFCLVLYCLHPSKLYVAYTDPSNWKWKVATVWNGAMWDVLWQLTCRSFANCILSMVCLVCRMLWVFPKWLCSTIFSSALPQPHVVPDCGGWTKSEELLSSIFQNWWFAMESKSDEWFAEVNKPQSFVVVGKSWDRSLTLWTGQWSWNNGHVENVARNFGGKDEEETKQLFGTLLMTMNFLINSWEKNQNNLAILSKSLCLLTYNNLSF